MKYNAIILGSGQAGNPMAGSLADHGWTVALAEKAHLGGTCINTGCTPTKTMVHRALVAHYARDAARWGVMTHDVKVDLAKIVAQKNQLVQSRRDGQQRSIDQRPNLHLYWGEARFTGPHSVTVGEQYWRASTSSSTPVGVRWSQPSPDSTPSAISPTKPSWS